MNIAVVDDNNLDREKLARAVEKWFGENNRNFRIETFESGEEILENSPEEFHIVFMDIIMNTINGIETAARIRSINSKVLIVFATSSKEFAFEAFPLHPFDYILKPFDPDRINYVLREAVNFLETPEPFINVKIFRSNYKIFLKNISAVLSRNHNVEIITRDGESLICVTTFKEIQEILLKEQRFIECNRGVIINMDQVKSLGKNKESFIMKDETQYAINVRRQKNIIENFTQYQFSRIRSSRHEI